MNTQIFESMRALGLAALSHANRIEDQTDKWAELSVLQVAHATEILFKARIAEEHPLLIFDKFPKPTRNTENKIIDELSISILANKGHTYEWHELPNVLWATTNITSIDVEKFKKFGDIRNSIQHFGISSDISYLTSLNFIYDVIEPFIYECWGLYAIDYSIDFNAEREENYEYWNYIRKYLLYNEIAFKLSPTLTQNKEQWWSFLKVDGSLLNTSYDDEFVEPIELSLPYYKNIQNQIDLIETQLKAETK